MMIADIPIPVLVYGLFIDSANAVVIGLLIAGLLFAANRNIADLLFPLITATLLGLGIFIWIPSQAIPPSSWFFLLTWFTTVGLMGLFIMRQYKKESFQQKIRMGILGILAIVTFVYSFIGFSQTTTLTALVEANNISLFFLLVILGYFINPITFIPQIPPLKPAKFCVYLALGLFVLRCGLWGYTAFNASVTEPPGSFVPRGILFAKEWADLWQFHQLQEIINTYWLKG
ncbi:hypothetical protein GF373_05825 [bacterium]|nr:hypothetical protein [bacterium]